MEEQKITIYYNKSCSKCRYALSALDEAGAPSERIEYLKDRPDPDKLAWIIDRLGGDPLQIIRQSEALYLENYKDKTLSKAEWIQVLHEHPILMQRPILIKGDQVIIGRTPEALEGML